MLTSLQVIRLRLLARLNAQLAHQGVLVQQGGGMIDASIAPTAARASCLDQVALPAGIRLLADTGYCSANNDRPLRQRGLRSGIQRKACRHKPLSVWEKRYNRLLGRSRYKIEWVLGHIQRWVGRLESRYVGMAKTHG